MPLDAALFGTQIANCSSCRVRTANTCVLRDVCVSFTSFATDAQCQIRGFIKGTGTSDSDASSCQSIARKATNIRDFLVWTPLCSVQGRMVAVSYYGFCQMLLYSKGGTIQAIGN